VFVKPVYRPLVHPAVVTPNTLSSEQRTKYTLHYVDYCGCTR
jgi:hypothetical protein